MCPPTSFSHHRTGASEKFRSTPRKTFFNSIGHELPRRSWHWRGSYSPESVAELGCICRRGYALSFCRSPYCDLLMRELRHRPPTPDAPARREKRLPPMAVDGRGTSRAGEDSGRWLLGEPHPLPRSSPAVEADRAARCASCARTSFQFSCVRSAIFGTPPCWQERERGLSRPHRRRGSPFGWCSSCIAP